MPVELPDDVDDVFVKSPNGDYCFSSFEPNQKAPYFDANSISTSRVFLQVLRVHQTIPLNICVVDGRPDPKELLHKMRKQSKELCNTYLISDLFIDCQVDCAMLPFSYSTLWG